MKFLEEKFVPIAAKIGTQKHLLAIRDSFVIMMPLTIAGSLSVLFNNIGGIFAENGLNMPAVQQGYTNFLTSTHLNVVFNGIHRASLGVMTILFLACLGYNLGKLGGVKNPMANAAITISAYLGLSPNVTYSIAEYVTGAAKETVTLAEPIQGSVSGTVAAGQLAAQGLFVAMIVGIAVGEIFPRLARADKLKISMPDGVPPAVADSFSSLIPAMITLFVIVATGSYIKIFSGQDVWQLVTKFVSAPLTTVADNVITVIIVFFLIDLLWVFGLHGAQIIGSITTPVLTPMNQKNIELFANGEEPIYTYTSGLHAGFTFLGGSGATIGLIIAIFLFSKSKAARTVAQISIAPGIFEINEPLTFGLPIVMNPIYAIPFIVGPIILAVSTYFLMEAGFVRRGCIDTPWVTPPILIGFLCTGGDFRGAIWNVIEIVILVVIWSPFVMMNDKLEAKQAAD